MILLPFGKFELLDDTVIATLHHGVHFGIDENRTLIELLNRHYGSDTPINMIFIHKYDYSFNPLIFSLGHANKNVCSIALIENADIENNVFTILKRFFKVGKIKIFNDIQKAQQWCDQQLMNYLWKNNSILKSS